MGRFRHGLTLLQWVALFICWGIIISLLIPATNRARGPVRTNQCAVNLKNLSLAAIQREEIKREFPGFVMDFGTWDVEKHVRDRSNLDADPKSLRTHRKIGTWAVGLIPWLDALPTYEAWTNDSCPIAFGGSSKFPLSSGNGGIGFTSIAAPNLPIFQCPSDPTDDGTHGPNSYICNTGMYHRGPRGEEAWQMTGQDGDTKTIDFLESMSADRGVFNNQFAGLNRSGNPVPVGPAVRLEDFTDGQSHTMLFSESLQAMPWHRAGFIDATDLVMSGDVEIRFNESSRYTQGMLWHDEGSDNSTSTPAINPLHRINAAVAGVALEDLQMNRGNAHDLARPSSAHVDGVNASFADGSTRYIADSIEYRVYRALLTPGGDDDQDSMAIICDY